MTKGNRQPPFGDETLHPETVGDLVLEQGIAALDASAAMLLTVDEDGDALHLLAARGYPSENARQFQTISADAPLPACETLRRGKPVFVANPEAYARQFPESASTFEVSSSAAFACFPLTERDETVGVVVFSFAEPREFTARDRGFMNAAANLGALALQRARYHVAATRERQIAQWLATISRVLGETLDYRKALDELARAAVPEFADWCAIELIGFGPPGRYRTVAHVDPEKAALVERLRAQYPLSPDFERGTTRVLNGGHSELYSDVSDELLVSASNSTEHLELLRSLELRSALIAPVTARGRTIGTLTLLSSDINRRFDSRDVDFAEDVGQRLGLAVDNARQYEAAKALAEFGREAISCSTTELLESAVELLCKELHVELVTILSHSDDQLTVRSCTGWDLAVDSPEQIASLLGPHALYALSKGEPVVTTDFARETRFDAKALIEHHGIQSGLAKVTPGPDRPYGVLLLHSRSPRRFTDEEIQFAKGVNNVLSAAIARERSQTFLASERLRMAAFLDSAMDAIITADEEQRITVFNQAAEKMFGYTADEVIGGPLSALMPERYRDEHQREVEEFGKNGRTNRTMGERGTVLARRKNGEEFPIEATISQVDGPHGKIFSVIIRDVTQRMRAEEELRKAARQKDRFLAVLGHELRNPLNAIRSALQLQRVAEQNQRTVERARAIIDRQTDHMARLLDDLLDVSRIVRGKVNLQMERVNLTELVESVVADHEVRAETDGVELVLESDDSDPWIEGDRARMVQIVGNLVDNAVKFSAYGDVVRVVVRTDDDQAIVQVRDRGIGIGDEYKDQIFTPFRQLAEDSEPGGGLGLGLALVKNLVALHGGTVECNSKGPGLGTVFTVSFKAVAAPTVPTDPSIEIGDEDSPRHRVLLVEDDDDAAEALDELLRLLGHETRIARSGAEALEAAREFDPTIVLCDIGLPGDIDGYDVARALRSDDFASEAHLIALTGYGRDEDRDQALQCGFDNHMKKPLDIDALEEVLRGTNDKSG